MEIKGNLYAGEGSSATGNTSFAFGLNTTASGDYSHSEGQYTTASGIGSHAEGIGSLAIGSNSHAEGQQTTASGTNSHAEGLGSLAIGSNSHTEGSTTTASGIGSHAEGIGSLASGDYSHAEGQQTTASGQGSHAEGFSTIASGDYSHAEGQQTTASGTNSHAGGWGGNTKKPVADGVASFVHYRVNSGGPFGTFGAYAAHSAILGGLNHHIFALADDSAIIGGGGNTIEETGLRSVILGGQNITASASNTVYVPNLNINTTPSNDNVLTQILVRDNITGDVKYKDVNSFTDLRVTGGTYDINTGIVSFTNNSGNTFDVSGFTSGMTDSYTTSASLSGTVVSFDNNIQGSNFYSVDLSGLTSSFTGQSLSQTLSIDNATGGNYIITSNNDVVKAENGGGELNLRDGADDNVKLSISGGSEYLIITPTYTELFSTGYIGIYSPNSGNDTSDDFVGHYLFSNNNKYARVGFQVESNNYISKFGARGANPVVDGFNIYAGANDDQIITPINGGGNTIISSRNTTLNIGLRNTVVLGGNGITATNSNTVYVPNLNINKLGTGTSINTLGIDTNGFVVTGATIDTNFANTNLTFTGNREHNTNGNYYQITSDNSGFLEGWFIVDPNYVNLGYGSTSLYADVSNFNISVSGITRIRNLTSETVINDGGNDINFRVEGDTNQHLLFVDAGTDRVGINSSVPDSKLSIATLKGDGISFDGMTNASVVGKHKFYTKQGEANTLGTATTILATIPLLSGERITVRGLVTAIGSGDLVIGGTFSAVGIRTGATPTIIGTVDSSIKHNSIGSPSVTVSANTGNIIIVVTGGGEATAGWAATYEYQIISNPLG